MTKTPVSHSTNLNSRFRDGLNNAGKRACKCQLSTTNGDVQRTEIA